jgi:hypothetical protein
MMLNVSHQAGAEAPVMYVEDMVRKCVLFLGNKDEKSGRFIPRATAFVASVVGFRFLVTAEHNISNFAKKGWEIYIRSNLVNGGVREDDWSRAHWYFHPNIGSTDVAVATVDFTPTGACRIKKQSNQRASERRR